MRKKLLDGFARQQHHFGRRLVPDDVFVVFAIVQRVKFYIIAAPLTPIMPVGSKNSAEPKTP